MAYKYLQRLTFAWLSRVNSCVFIQLKNYNQHMKSPSTVAQLVDRVDRLLLRYEELQRTNQLFTDNVRILTSERDSARLRAARLRVETLIKRLAESDEKL